MSLWSTSVLVFQIIVPGNIIYYIQHPKNLVVNNNMKEVIPKTLTQIMLESLINAYVHIGNIANILRGVYPSKDGSYITEIYLKVY